MKRQKPTIEARPARWPWAIALCAAALMLMGQVYEAAAGVNLDGGPIEQALMALAFLAFPFVGALIMSRRRDNRFGWVLMAIGVMAALIMWGMGTSAYYLPDPSPHPLAVLGAWFEAWLWFPIIGTIPTFFLLLFPNGELPSRRWRWVARLSFVSILVMTVPSAVEERLAADDYNIDNPIGISGLGDVEGALDSFFLAFVALCLLSAFSVFWRFRRAGIEERQQLKWFMSAAVFFVVGVSLGDLLQLPGIIFPLGLLGLLGAIAIAVLKYRLYEIDLLINRTIVYASLTAILAGIYLLVVFTMQRVLQGLTAESDIAVAASTLAVAAMFRPLRSRVQEFINRRFYRRKYDAQRTLEAFGARLRDDVDLHHLSSDLASVVQETMQPTHVSIWLRGSSGSQA